MTLEEKLAQMSQFNTNCLILDSEGGVTGPAMDLSLTPEEIAATGSTLNFTGAAEMKRAQKLHLDVDRLKIPMLFMQDVIHGFRTIYPIPLGMGASFDADLVKECSAMAAKEAAVGGVQVTFGPMVDLVRDARWGRCMESTGEDVYLNSLMGKAQVEGYQGDYSSKYNIAACVKHFAAYGAAESGRDYNTVDMSMRSLRDYYLPAYKACIDAGVDMVMTSFNLINGVPSSGNKWLVDDLLRKEWGFDKVVISDYNAFREMKVHGYCKDDYECADAAITAGTDIEMMSTCYLKHASRLIDEGKLSVEKIDKAVMRILELKQKLGLFDNPYGAADEEEEKKLFLCPEHRALARRAAEKSAVLLKNDGVLPFADSAKSVAVIGPFADKGMIGFWSCHGRSEEAVSAYEGIAAMLGKDKVFFAKGADSALLARPEAALIDEAVRLAERCDLVVLALGEEGSFSGEGNSRADITLSEAQKELVRRVSAVNPNSVSVLYCGRPLALGDIIDYMKATVVMWQPGTEGGSALANLLFGKVDFEARLPQSFPYHVGQEPLYYNRMNTGRPRRNEFKAGNYISQYLDYPNIPLYPFGYGLSYADFEISAPEVSSALMKRGETVTVSAELKNTSDKEGSTLVQLYVRDMVASLVRPIKELRGFKRVSLAPGASAKVEFTLTEDDLKFYTEDGVFAAESGEFRVFVGLSSAENRAVSFNLE